MTSQRSFSVRTIPPRISRDMNNAQRSRVNAH
jgi:hypothetical protein